MAYLSPFPYKTTFERAYPYVWALILASSSGDIFRQLAKQQNMLSRGEIKELKKRIVWDDTKVQPLFHALSDPNRCRILRLLIRSGKHVFSVSDIAALLGVSIPTASAHLKILETGGALRRTREKQKVHYEIRTDDPFIKSIVSIITVSKH